MEKTICETATWCEGWRKSPLLLRLLGGPKSYFADGSRCFRMRWGELSLGGKGIALRIGAYETAHLNIAFLFFQIFLRLPFLDRAMTRGFGESPSFGFSADGTTLHLNWGKRCKVIWLPWCRENIAHAYLSATGEWIEGWPPREEGGDVWEIELPYAYLLNSVEVQKVIATVRRTRCWWGRRFFGSRGLSAALRRMLPQRVEDFIDVRFSDEVGERAGSWKGGTVGCGYQMKPGETPQHTLRRMQRERRFR